MGEPRVDTAGSRDGAPSGARAGESGDQSCLVCVLEGRPRGLGGGRPGGGARRASRGVGGCPGGRACTVVVAALSPLAKQEVPGALPAGCWPGLPALLGTPSPQARAAGMHPHPGPGLSGPPAPHRRPDTPSPAGTAWGSSFLEEVVLGLASGPTGERPGARTCWGLHWGWAGAKLGQEWGQGARAQGRASPAAPPPRGPWTPSNLGPRLLTSTFGSQRNPPPSAAPTAALSGEPRGGGRERLLSRCWSGR